MSNKLLALMCNNILLFSNVIDHNFLISHVKESIDRAEKNESHLNSEILSLKGMSSAKVRHFLNNLCSINFANYLEIGVWQGSTFISAVYGNNLKSAYAIDNWSEFGSARFDFITNISKFLNPNVLTIIENDAFKIDIKECISEQINIFFYDGNHSEISQILAFTYYDEKFDDVFIAVVDDYNWEDVKKGTKTAFSLLNYKILYERILPANYNGDVANWWNGLYVAVLQKPKNKGNL